MQRALIWFKIGAMNDTSKPIIADAKAALRMQAQAVRGRVHGDFALEGRRLLALRAGKIMEQCALKSGAVVAGYHPINDEIDSLGLLSELRCAGSKIALPRMRGHGQALDFYGWDSAKPLVKGAYGVMEPSGDSAVLVPQVVLLPLLAFDLGGGRLGYGGGYYDRTLEGLRAQSVVISVGVGYDEQEVTDVPRDGHDQLLDYIVTPTRMIKALRQAV